MCIAPISDFAYSVKYFSVTASIHKVIKQSTSAGLWGERERLEWQQRFRGETWDIKRLQRSRLEFTVPRRSWSGGRLPVPHQEGGGRGWGREEKWWVVVHVLLWTTVKGFYEWAWAYLCLLAIIFPFVVLRLLSFFVKEDTFSPCINLRTLSPQHSIWISFCHKWQTKIQALKLSFQVVCMSRRVFEHE